MNVTIGANCWDGARRKLLFASPLVEMPAFISDSPHTFKARLMDAAKRMNDPKVKAVIGFTIPLMLIASGIPSIPVAGIAFTHHVAVSAFAPEAVPASVIGGAIKDKVLHAFDPLIDLITTLAYPIAGVMIAAGCLFIMVGNRDKGMSMLQNAAIGYLLVQLAPMLLKLLVGIGASV